MNEVLLTHFKRFMGIDEVTFKEIASLFTELNLQKRQLVVEESNWGTHIYFVVNGCLRLYYIDDKGAEPTIQFALEE